MRWLLVLASVTTCVWARPSRRLSGDVEAQQLPRQNRSQSVPPCDDVNRTLADSARAVESRSSRPRSRQTPNCSSESTPGDAWKPTSREASSASSVTLNVTSEDTAAFPGSSMAESYPVAARLGLSSYGCAVPTCSVAHLGSKLQAGEETAGGSTLDPQGFGKK